MNARVRIPTLFDGSYDCVIATRNRLSALRMSIPLILKQDTLPQRLIIVDASEDHEFVRTEVHQLSKRFGYKNTIVSKADTANSARQRNIGLQFVDAPIVMFPDDDSMWYDKFATNVLKIYGADVRRQVGGVGGVSVFDPTPRAGATRLQEERNCERERGAAALQKPHRKSSLSSPFQIDRSSDLDGRN